MKKVFYTFLASLTLVACQKGGDAPKLIELTQDTETTQIVYADETSKPEAIKFKATTDWTATVSEETKANNIWIKLSAYEGKVGNNTIDLLLESNSTGKDRQAKIRIECGGTITTITVEQKTITKPVDPNAPKLRYVKKITTKNESGEFGLSFEYDTQMRIIQVISSGTYTYDDITKKGSVTSNCSYQDNVITVKTNTVTDGNLEDTRDASMILNPDGTTKQTVTIIEKYDNTPSQSGYVINHRSDLLSLRTNIGATKSQVVERLKEIRDYTYDSNGYVVSIKSRKEDLDDTESPDATPREYILSWDNGNLLAVEGKTVSLHIKDALSYSDIEQKRSNLDFIHIFGSGEAHSLATNDAAGMLGHIGKHSKLLNIKYTSTYTEAENSNPTESKSHIHNYTYTLDKDGYVIGLVIINPQGSKTTSTVEYR